MCRKSWHSTTSDGLFLPAVLAIHTAMIAAPAVSWYGVAACLHAEVLCALAIVSAGVTAEIGLQAGLRHQWQNVPIESRAATVLNLLQGLCMLVTLQSLLVEAAGRRGPITTWTGLGAVVMVAGIVWRCWAIHTLGRGFTDGFSPSVDLVKAHGPYRYLRHPAELGLLAIPVGMAMLLASCRVIMWTAPWLMVCATARITAEEWAMATASSGPLGAMRGITLNAHAAGRLG